jgi:succinate dehydrogenase/fumarate reductase flavoprotein subunit
LAERILAAQGYEIDSVSGASMTSNAVMEAAANCIAQARGISVDELKGNTGDNASESGASDWLGEAPEIAESDITETVDTEVLVIGASTAGWPAAISAAEAGAKTLLIEKNAKYNSPKGDIGAINSDIQLAGFAQFPDFKINKIEALQDIVRYANGYCNSDLVRLWANESGELVNWYTKILEDSGMFEMKWEASVGTPGGRDKAYATGHSPDTTEANTGDNAKSTGDVLNEYGAAQGLEVRLSCELVKFEQDANGKVTGAICKDGEDGHYIRINASNGVICCAGGYPSNEEMMLALQPETMAMKMKYGVTGGGNGSGIKACLWAGGTMDSQHASMMFNRGCVLPDQTAGYQTDGKQFWFGEQPFLKLNLNGKRFCNESGPYEYMLHSAYLQPSHTYVDIWDSDWKEQVRSMNEVGCCRLYEFENGAPSNHDIDYVEGKNAELEEAGYIQSADTIEELAAKLNLPVENVVASVVRYNELAALGEDEDYGKEANRLLPLSTPPYYGVRVAAWHLTTLDGININTNMNAVREDGSVIEGLYVCGDCSGGFFGNNYPNLFTGLAAGRSMTFGRRAGLIAAGAIEPDEV